MIDQLNLIYFKDKSRNKIWNRNFLIHFFYVEQFSKMKRFAQTYVVAEDILENIVRDVFMELWEKREEHLSGCMLLDALAMLKKAWKF